MHPFILFSLAEREEREEMNDEDVSGVSSETETNQRL